MMGRHVVFFKCSNFTTSTVLARLLTGIILSGSWICFDEAHNLPQGLLHIAGEYLRSIRQSYNYLTLSNSKHSSINYLEKTDDLKANYQVRIYLL